MDYTSAALIKSELHIEATTDDALLARFATAASRTIDKLTARSQFAVDYFLLEDVANEEPRGAVESSGSIVFWPRKARVVSIASLEYRSTPMANWAIADTQRVAVEGMHTVRFYASSTMRPSRVFVKVSYRGGLAENINSLQSTNADLVEMATVLAARMYREAEGGLNDSVGIAELGVITYTKALPARVVEGLKPYQRTVPW